MASARHGADAARQCRERARLVWLGPGLGAAIPGRSARYARLWPIDADAARLPVDLGSLGRGFLSLDGQSAHRPLPSRRREDRRHDRPRLRGAPPRARQDLDRRRDAPALARRRRRARPRAGPRIRGARRRALGAAEYGQPPRQHLPAQGFEWWCKFMGRTALSTQLGFMGTIACADIRPDVPKIACPTLVVTTEESGLATVDATRAWQEQIAGSELVVLPGNSYHVAATHAAESAKAALDFIGKRGGG